MMKDVVFVDNALDEIKGFSRDARREAGYQIDRVQRGDEPTDWKPMASIGPGVREIRIHDSGEYRVIYIAKFADAIYVLHGFEKKTQRTPKQNIALAKQRFRGLIAARKQR